MNKDYVSAKVIRVDYYLYDEKKNNEYVVTMDKDSITPLNSSHIIDQVVTIKTQNDIELRLFVPSAPKERVFNNLSFNSTSNLIITTTIPNYPMHYRAGIKKISKRRIGVLDVFSDSKMGDSILAIAKIIKMDGNELTVDAGFGNFIVQTSIPAAQKLKIGDIVKFETSRLDLIDISK